jgi:Cd(II)/Pb(II)-responsive transcriptional regulator
MKIGELAKRTGCPVQTIRFYEQEGLLPTPARSEGNFRLYGEGHVERLTLIRNCRLLDMTLDEIRTLMHFRDEGGEDCGTVDSLLDEHIVHVMKRIEELQSLERQLRSLRDKCCLRSAMGACAILRGLSERQDTGGVQGVDVHVSGTHS